MLGVCAFSVRNDMTVIIRLCITLRTNVECMSLAWEMNDGNYICLRMTLEIIIGSLSFMLEMNLVSFELCLLPKKLRVCL